MKNNIVKTITSNAIVAAIYFLLTIISGPFSFGLIQVRVAEALVLLCFFRKDFVIGITVGCLLSNTLSGESMGIFDIIIGTSATFCSGFFVSKFKHLGLSSIVPILINGILIGLEIFLLGGNDTSLIACIGFVTLGEFIAVFLIGYLALLALWKNKHFLEVINANQNIEFKW